MNWLKESAYGDKRNYPKIDIFENGKYVGSTNWAKSCAEAKQHYVEFEFIEDPSTITAFYAKE